MQMFAHEQTFGEDGRGMHELSGLKSLSLLHSSGFFVFINVCTTSCSITFFSRAPSLSCLHANCTGALLFSNQRRSGGL